jgi:hypothetical protein
MSCNVTKQEGFFFEMLVAFTVEEVWLVEFIFDESLEKNFLMLQQVKDYGLSFFTSFHGIFSVSGPTHIQNFRARPTFLKNL